MTLSTLQSWPDFDDDGNPMSETLIGFDNTPIASVLATEHHDAFLRLALAAPGLLHALEIARDHLEVSNHEGEEDETLALINAAITKAQGA